MKPNYDELKTALQNYKDIQCYTEFEPDDFESKSIQSILTTKSLSYFSIDIEKDNDKPLHQAISLEGVPMYFVLDFAGKPLFSSR